MYVCIYLCIYVFIYLFTNCLTTQVTCPAYEITLHFTPVMILNKVYNWIFFNGSRALVGTGLICTSNRSVTETST